MKKIDKIFQDICYIVFITLSLFTCCLIVLLMDSFNSIEKFIIMICVIPFILVLSVILNQKIKLYQILKIGERLDKKLKQRQLIASNPLEKVYSKEQLDQLDSAAEYSKRAEEYFDNPENYRELK